MIKIEGDELELIKAVLPNTGDPTNVYCLFGFSNGDSKKILFNDFFENVSDLIEAAERHLNDPKGVHLHFNMASFSDRKRDQVHATHLQSFVLDIDIKDGDNTYSDVGEAFDHTKEFCSKLGIPIPTFVESGGGVHLYWTFTEPVGAKEWFVAADRLDRVIKQYGSSGDPKNPFLVDHNITKNSAHSLRLPGSVNYKYKAEPRVKVTDLRDPIEFSVIENALDGAAVPKRSPRDLINIDRFNTLVADDPYLHSFEEILAASAVGSGCELLRLHHAEPDKDGSEPLYWALLNIARRCEDKEEAYATLSENAEAMTYVEGDTARVAFETENATKIRELEDSNYPTPGCDQIMNKAKGAYTNADKICKSCPNRKLHNAPLSISQKNKPAGEIINYVDRAGVSGVYVVPELPPSYYRVPGGGIGGPDVRKDAKPGANVAYCLTDVFVERVILDEGVDFHFGAEIAVVTHSSGVVRTTIRKGDLEETQKARRMLADLGVHILGPQALGLMNYLMAAFAKLEQERGVILTRKQLGWTPDLEGSREGFVVGDLEYRGEDEEPVKIPVSAELSNYVAKGTFTATKQGDLKEWTDIANRWGAEGWEGQCFAFFSAFGSPLFHMTTFNGALVCMYSDGSGAAKSTTLDLINSVFGHPEDLRMVVDTTTKAALHNQGVLNSICATYDELTYYDSKQTSNLVHMISQGKGGDRMESQKNQNRENNTEWHMCAVGGSNISLRSKIRQENVHTEAEEMRLIEYEVGLPPGVDTNEANVVIREGLLKHYGQAGRIYANYLVDNYDEVKKRFADMREEFITEYSMTPKERFYTAMFTANILGATIANELGLININVARVKKWIFETLLPELRKEASTSLTEPVQILSEYLFTYAGNQLILRTDVDGRGSKDTDDEEVAEAEQMVQAPRGKLLIRVAQDTMTYWITKSHFSKHISQIGGNKPGIIRELEKLGFIEVVEGECRKTLSAGTSLSGGPTRCYIINGRKLELYKQGKMANG